MHPMFVKLYLETDADDVAEERKRRAASRAKRLQSRAVVKTVARTPGVGPQR
jgi:muconolactone delta-isomerase